MKSFRRRDLLVTAALLAGSGFAARSVLADTRLPWAPNAGAPPEPFEQGSWKFFTDAEGAAMEAIVDRMIPPDPETVGGKDAGCAVFIDRQLAGPYGRREGLYIQPPFLEGTKQQGPQDKDGPAGQYRSALAAIDRFSRSAHDGRAFIQLSDEEKDSVLGGLESNRLHLDGVDGKSFFEMLLLDVQQGFFADPIYGGNRDMAGWRMIGYPGARYDYRDWVNRHNEPYPLPPVSLQGRPEWSGRSSG